MFRVYAAAADDVWQLEADVSLDRDDECQGKGCALMALQLRSLPQVSQASSVAFIEQEIVEDILADNSTPNDDVEDDIQNVDLPPGWNDFPDVQHPEEQDTENSIAASGGCEHHTNEHRCYLFRACHGKHYCVINGYMIVPGRAVSGMESINGGNAGSLDFLMRAARGRCGSSSCVLITNPVGFRTQDQLHIHFRHYNGGGAGLKKRLEKSLCGSHGWKGFNECGSAKARLFSGFPGVFSSVASAYGGGSLANVGISVWFTSACGGFKTIVLATTHCSIEHSVSSR